MPGVYRPYTLADILGTINNNANGGQDTTDIIDGLGQFVETAEAATAADVMTGTAVVASTATWDNVTWGTFVWS